MSVGFCEHGQGAAAGVLRLSLPPPPPLHSRGPGSEYMAERRLSSAYAWLIGIAVYYLSKAINALRRFKSTGTSVSVEMCPGNRDDRRTCGETEDACCQEAENVIETRLPDEAAVGDSRCSIDKYRSSISCLKGRRGRSLVYLDAAGPQSALECQKNETDTALLESADTVAGAVGCESLLCDALGDTGGLLPPSTMKLSGKRNEGRRVIISVTPSATGPRKRLSHRSAGQCVQLCLPHAQLSQMSLLSWLSHLRLGLIDLSRLSSVACGLRLPNPRACDVDLCADPSGVPSPEEYLHHFALPSRHNLPLRIRGLSLSPMEVQYTLAVVLQLLQQRGRGRCFGGDPDGLPLVRIGRSSGEFSTGGGILGYPVTMWSYVVSADSGPTEAIELLLTPGLSFDHEETYLSRQQSTTSDDCGTQLLRTHKSLLARCSHGPPEQDGGRVRRSAGSLGTRPQLLSSSVVPSNQDAEHPSTDKTLQPHSSAAMPSEARVSLGAASQPGVVERGRADNREAAMQHAEGAVAAISCSIDTATAAVLQNAFVFAERACFTCLDEVPSSAGDGNIKDGAVCSRQLQPLLGVTADGLSNLSMRPTSRVVLPDGGPQSVSFPIEGSSTPSSGSEPDLVGLWVPAPHATPDSDSSRLPMLRSTPCPDHELSAQSAFPEPDVVLSRTCQQQQQTEPDVVSCGIKPGPVPSQLFYPACEPYQPSAIVSLSDSDECTSDSTPATSPQPCFEACACLTDTDNDVFVTGTDTRSRVDPGSSPLGCGCSAEERKQRRRQSAKECVSQGSSVIEEKAPGENTCSSVAKVTDNLPASHRPLIRQAGALRGDSSTFPPMSPNHRKSLRRIFTASSVLSMLSKLRRPSPSLPSATVVPQETAVVGAGICADSVTAESRCLESQCKGRNDAVTGSRSSVASRDSATSRVSTSKWFSTAFKSRSFSDLRGRLRKSDTSHPTSEPPPLQQQQQRSKADGDTALRERGTTSLVDKRRGKCKSMVMEGSSHVRVKADSSGPKDAGHIRYPDESLGVSIIDKRPFCLPGRADSPAAGSADAEVGAEKPAVRRLPVNSHLVRANRYSMPSLSHALTIHELRAAGADGASRPSAEQARQERSRRLVELTMDELVLTESDYAAALSYVVDEYAMPKTGGLEFVTGEIVEPAASGSSNRRKCKSAIQYPSSVQVLFGNIVDISAFHCQRFLPNLEACVSEPFSTGACFLKYREEFLMYSDYIRNKPKSDALIASIGITSFRHKQAQLADPLDLASYLLKPVQRLGKYALILRRLIKECGEDDARHSELLKAEEMIRFCLRHGNDLLAMDALCDRTGVPMSAGLSTGVMAAAARLLLRQDELVVVHANRSCRRRVFLFEHLILFSKPRPVEGGMEKYSFKFSMKTCHIGLTETVGCSDTQFEVWLHRRKKDSASWTLQAASAEVKNNWVKDISGLLWGQAKQKRDQQALLSPIKCVTLIDVGLTSTLRTERTAGDTVVKDDIYGVHYGISDASSRDFGLSSGGCEGRASDDPGDKNRALGVASSTDCTLVDLSHNGCAVDDIRNEDNDDTTVMENFLDVASNKDSAACNASGDGSAEKHVRSEDNMTDRLSSTGSAAEEAGDEDGAMLPSCSCSHGICPVCSALTHPHPAAPGKARAQAAGVSCFFSPDSASLRPSLSSAPGCGRRDSLTSLSNTGSCTLSSALMGSSPLKCQKGSTSSCSIGTLGAAGAQLLDSSLESPTSSALRQSSNIRIPSFTV